MMRILKVPDAYIKPCFSDSSNKGYGLLHGTHWLFGAFHLTEVKTKDENNIREREMFPILIGCQTFGPYWSGHRVHMFIDNENAMRAIINKDIRNEKSHQLLIRICETMMKYKFEIHADRVSTEDNTLADALSRFKIKKFKNTCKQNNIPIDPAPMLHQRPQFDLGYISITQHQPVQYDDQ